VEKKYEGKSEPVEAHSGKRGNKGTTAAPESMLAFECTECREGDEMEALTQIAHAQDLTVDCPQMQGYRRQH
jgi:hypothetical protein